MFLKDISYKEKSIWLSLGLTSYLLYFYFSGIVSLNNQQLLTDASFTELLSDTIIWLTTLLVTFHIIIAALHAKEAEQKDDERDNKIEMIGTRNAYYLLILGMFVAISHIKAPFIAQLGISIAALSPGYNMMHFVIISFLIAELVKNSTQIVYYRRGF